MRSFLQQLRSLTFTIRIKVQDTAGPYHSLQGNDLVEWHPKQLIVIETAGWRVVGLVGAEVVMTEGKTFLSKEERESFGRLARS